MWQWLKYLVVARGKAVAQTSRGAFFVELDGLGTRPDAPEQRARRALGACCRSQEERVQLVAEEIRVAGLAERRKAARLIAQTADLCEGEPGGAHAAAVLRSLAEVVRGVQ